MGLGLGMRLVWLFIICQGDSSVFPKKLVEIFSHQRFKTHSLFSLCLYHAGIRNATVNHASEFKINITIANNHFNLLLNSLHFMKSVLIL